MDASFDVEGADDAEAVALSCVSMPAGLGARASPLLPPVSNANLLMLWEDVSRYGTEC